MNYIFPTPIEIVTPSNVEEIQKEILEQIYHINFKPVQDLDHGKVEISNGTLEENIIEQLNLVNLKNTILLHVNKYCEELEIITEVPLSISKSWILKTKQYGHGSRHAHRCLIAGVYYFKTFSTSGNLRFHINTDDEMIKMFNGQYVDYTPEIGKLVLFPGWLSHEILTNLSNEDRISIGFNIDV